jgi:hypothetical protein
MGRNDPIERDFYFFLNLRRGSEAALATTTNKNAAGGKHIKTTITPAILRRKHDRTGSRQYKWVAQVSLLRPGFLIANWSWPENPGLKSETWATHLLFVRAGGG